VQHANPDQSSIIASGDDSAFINHGSQIFKGRQEANDNLSGQGTIHAEHRSPITESKEATPASSYVNQDRDHAQGEPHVDSLEQEQN